MKITIVYICSDFCYFNRDVTDHQSHLNSSVGMLTRLLVGRPKNRGLISCKGEIRFSVFQNVQTGSEVHPASYSAHAGLKRPRLEADHLFHVVSLLRIHEAVLLLHHTLFFCSIQDRLDLFAYFPVHIFVLPVCSYHTLADDTVLQFYMEGSPHLCSVQSFPALI